MLTNESASPTPARKMPFVMMLPCTQPHGKADPSGTLCQLSISPLSALCQPITAPHAGRAAFAWVPLVFCARIAFERTVSRAPAHEEEGRSRRCMGDIAGAGSGTPQTKDLRRALDSIREEERHR